MTVLNDEARALLSGNALAHLVTLNSDGGPQASVIWVGLDGDEIVSAHLGDQQKLRNMRRDPRVVLTLETSRVNDHGLAEYMIVYARARITPGGAPAMLQRLAHVYLGPDVVFPPMPNPPEGSITHYTVERIGGVGPWNPPSAH